MFQIDKWFKPAILVLMVLFLFIFGLHAFKGRYRTMGTSHNQILDTFTGNVYDRYGQKLIPPPERLPTVYVPYNGPVKPEKEGEQH